MTSTLPGANVIAIEPAPGGCVYKSTELLQKRGQDQIGRSKMDGTGAPDIETSSEGYARRFDGPVGQYFLATQCRIVEDLLGVVRIERGRVLEVGGGHGQLTAMLMAMGFHVTVQGSAPSCGARVRDLRWQETRPGFVASSLLELPFGDQTFDVVIGLRVMAHIERWQDLLREMARVSRCHLLIDYAALASVNRLERWLFPVKRVIEGDTRGYFCHSSAAVRRSLASLGFSRFRMEKQFVVPMALHRGMNNRAVSEFVEGWSARLGVTRCFGSPVLLLAERQWRSAAAAHGEGQVGPAAAKIPDAA